MAHPCFCRRSATELILAPSESENIVLLNSNQEYHLTSVSLSTVELRIATSMAIDRNTVFKQFNVGSDGLTHKS